MADSLVDSALKKIEELASQELKLQTEVGKKVQGLKDDLEWLRVLLRHADQRRRQEFNDYIELWVQQTREVAFDAEDLLEEYFHRGRLHCHGVLDLPSFLRWLRNGAIGLFVRHSICDNIDGIKNRLEEIKKKTEDHDLKSIPSTWAHPQKHFVDWYNLNEYTMEDPRKLVGVKDNSDKIKKWLMDPEEKRIVIAITGKSGIGKTTLASSIYERSSVRSRFDCTIWVHIPQKFRMEDVLGEIIQDATGVDVTEPEKTELTKPRDDDRTWITSKLAATLGGKKYLIVLDNVRSLEEWKFFLAVLPDDGKKGSRVVITSQVKPTAPHGSGTRNHGEKLLQDISGRPCLYRHHVELKKLEKDDGSKMFCIRMFDKEEFPDDFRHKDIHSMDIRNLLQHCLPLAVTLLAGLLRTKKEEEWNSVIKSLQESRKEKQLEEKEEEEEVEEGEEEQEGEQGEGEKEKQKAKKKKKKKKRRLSITYRQLPLVDRILMLSFDDLPPHLKQCFLYFAAFKAEVHIASEKLIRLWVAEGFVQNTDARTMEELGQEYLKMLISRCLINLVDVGYNNNIVTVSIHDHVHAFTMSEALETNFLHVRNNTKELSRATIRRLSIQNTFDPNTRLTLAIPKLRSVLCEIPRTPFDEAKEGMESCLWPNIRSIFKKVSGFIMGRTVNSFSIYQCKFLRVIDLNGGAQATSASLPEEIGWLIHLRYLGLADTKFRTLPQSVAKLRNLQTLDITSTQISAVPKGFWEIKSLRHVMARRLNKCPRRIDALDNLHTLHGVPWGKWARKGAALKKMTNLRSLHVWRLSKGHHCDNLMFALTGMECLVSLEIADREDDQGDDLEANEAAANFEANGAAAKLEANEAAANLEANEAAANLEANEAAANLETNEAAANFPLNELLTMTVLRHLRYLRLHGQVKPPADQIHSYHLPNLTKLEVRKSGLVQGHIDMIGNLPNLAELVLGNGSYIEEHMVIPPAGFPELRKLRLKGLPNLMTWEVKDTNRSALWHLERMTIINCTNLTMIPDYLLKLEHLVQLTFHDLPKILQLPPLWKFSSKKLQILVPEQV